MELGSLGWQTAGRRTVLNWGQNTVFAKPHKVGRTASRGVGGGLREAASMAPTLGVEYLDTSTDRWGWAPGAQGDFQVGDPPTLVP